MGLERLMIVTGAHQTSAGRLVFARVMDADTDAGGEDAAGEEPGAAATVEKPADEPAPHAERGPRPPIRPNVQRPALRNPRRG
jgi:hypothetical protein